MYFSPGLLNLICTLELPTPLFFLMAFLDRDFVLVSTGTSEYTLTKEDVGHRLAFVYIPINFEG